MDDHDGVSISFVGDLSHSPPDDVLLVESDKDYVRACQLLSQAVTTHTGLNLWVRPKTLYQWLRDFTEQIACRASFEEKTARLVLAEQWNVRLPDWLTDAEVLDQRPRRGLFPIQDTGHDCRGESSLTRHFCGVTTVKRDIKLLDPACQLGRAARPSPISSSVIHVATP